MDTNPHSLSFTPDDTRLAGALFGHFFTAFSPLSFGFDIAFLTIAMLIVGGMTSVTGAVTGVFMLTFVFELFRRWEVDGAIGVTPPSGTANLVLAIVLLLTLILRPRGVTDGKEIIRYSARIAARETVSTGAGERSAWKVRIDGFEDAEVSGYDTGRESATGFEEQGEERLRHPPVYVWIDSGPRRVPLRLVSRHAVGKFTVALHEERTIQSAALPAFADTRLAR